MKCLKIYILCWDGILSANLRILGSSEFFATWIMRVIECSHSDAIEGVASYSGWNPCKTSVHRQNLLQKTLFRCLKTFAFSNHFTINFNKSFLVTYQELTSVSSGKHQGKCEESYAKTQNHVCCLFLGHWSTNIIFPHIDTTYGTILVWSSKLKIT